MELKKLVNLKSVKIRLLNSKDTELLYDFFCTLSKKTKRYFRPHPFDRNTARKLTKRVGSSREKRYLLITFSKGKEAPIGYGFLTRFHTELPSIGICIQDNFQGKGFGKALMKHLISVARQSGKKGLSLSVFGNNKPAFILYKKMGFRVKSYYMELLF